MHVFNMHVGGELNIKKNEQDDDLDYLNLISNKVDQDGWVIQKHQYSLKIISHETVRNEIYYIQSTKSASIWWRTYK